MEFYIREIYPWVVEVSIFSFAIPLAAAAFLANRRNGLLFNLLLLYVVFIALIEITGQLTVYLGTRNNYWIQHIYTPIEYVLLAVIYFYSFTSKYIRRGLVASMGVVALVSLLSIVLAEDITQMNSTPRMVAGTLLIAVAVLYFHQTATFPSFTYLDKDPMFLLSSGIIFYQAGTAMAFSMFNAALEASYDAARICISIIVVLNMLFRIVLTFALKRAC